MNGPQITGRNGPIRLGALLGKGGEGAVYEVAGQPDTVAKIYLKEISPDHSDKLLAMQSLLTPRLASLTAWPSEVLRLPNGKVAGFLMPNMRGSKDIHTLYGPKSRLAEFPQADWRVLVRAALNTARAFAVLHESGCLVADVNHGGVRVSPNATVKLIDCDSFQVSSNSRTYLCEVGVENFTPPELQGKSFKQTPRTANHDNFGLAVLVFHLLMVGRHPFAGRYSGPEEMPIPKAIGQFRYAYSSDKASTRMEPPPTAPAAAIASPEITAMWEQAFGRASAQPGGRPTAERWVHALAKLESSFVRCSKHSGHYYFSGYGNCPWCPIESIGVALFPMGIGSTPVALGGPFSLDAVWTQIRAVQSPGHMPAIPVPAKPSPSQEVTTLVGSRNTWKAAGIFGGLTIFVLGITLKAELWFLWGGLAWITGGWMSGRGKDVNVTSFKNREQRAKTSYGELSARWTREASSASFDERKAQLQKLRDEWIGLPTLRQQRYANLVANRQKYALQKFLDGFEIEKASITGIGPAKKAMLESYGVETAADVSRNAVLEVPGFGPALAQRLLDWRSGIEKRFRFDPKSGVDPRYIADMDQTIAQRRGEIEKELRQGAGALQQLRSVVLARRQALESPLRQAAIELAQASADLEAVS